MGVSITSWVLIVVSLGSGGLTIDVDEEFIKKYVERHNYFRSLHHAPPLKLNESLSVESQTDAENLLDWSDELDFEAPENYGCNIYNSGEQHSFYQLPPDLPVNDWYSGGQSYDYGEEPANIYDLSEHVQEFTQLIWNDTLYLGIGVARHTHWFGFGSRTYVVVSWYWPRGNIIGKFKENVLPVDLNDITTTSSTTPLPDDDDVFIPEIISVLWCLIVIIILYLTAFVCVLYLYVTHLWKNFPLQSCPESNRSCPESNRSRPESDIGAYNSPLRSPECDCGHEEIIRNSSLQSECECGA